MVETIRKPPLSLQASLSTLIVCDLQTRLLPVIHQSERIVRRVEVLVQAAACWPIPIIATEQYPEKLGSTIESLQSSCTQVLPKLEFSGWSALNWKPADEATTERTQIVLCGIESHICILQTALDLLAQGYQVFIPYDATGSYRPEDVQWALQRMMQAGATIVSTESVLFEWCQTSKAPQFKTISQLIKSTRGD